MRLTKRQLRQIIREEAFSLNESWLGDKWEEWVTEPATEFIQDDMIEPVLDKVEVALANYLIDNAETIADATVPEIPYEGDIVQNFTKRIIVATLNKKADEIANCTRNLMDPELIASVRDDK